MKNFVYIVTFAVPFFSTWEVIGNAVTPTPIYILIGFADAVLQFKILGNKLGILT